MTTENIAAACRARSAPLSNHGRFDRISMSLHWLTVLLLLLQVTTVWLWGKDADDAAALVTMHRTFGVTLWTVVVIRLVWRHTFAYLPPFPPEMAKHHQLLAKLNEYALYGVLVIQPLSGLGMSLFHGRSFGLFVWQVPTLAISSQRASHFLYQLHQFGAAALMGLVALHAAAALFHGIILRDGIVERMLPVWAAAKVQSRNGS